MFRFFAMFHWARALLADIAVMTETKTPPFAESGGGQSISAGTASPVPRRVGRRMAGGQGTTYKHWRTAGAWYRPTFQNEQGAASTGAFAQTGAARSGGFLNLLIFSRLPVRFRFAPGRT